MSSNLFYQYKTCSTCQKARRFLDQHEIPYEDLPIVETPPSIEELRRMLEFLKKKDGSFRNLFNTSGVLYREMKISERLKAGLSEEDALKLLAKNGKLIKRPFLLTPRNGFVGFREEEWTSFFKV